MNPFELFLKIFPLYILIAIGFVAGKRTKLQASDLAVINLQFIAPLIYFEAVSRLEVSAENVILPITCFALLSLLSSIVFGLTKLASKDGKKPFWIAACYATTNSGYFGIPVFLMTFGPENLGAYMLYAVGSMIFFYTVTHYLILRDRGGIKDSLLKLLRQPMIYAILIGFMCQSAGWRLPSEFDGFFSLLRGAFSVIGMMILGIVLSRQAENEDGFIFDPSLVFSSNLTRFLLFPGLAIGAVMIDRALFQIFSPVAQQIIILVSLMPMGADTTSLAAQWDMQPRRIAGLTLVNSTLALIVIPFLLPVLLAL